MSYTKANEHEASTRRVWARAANFMLTGQLDAVEQAGMRTAEAWDDQHGTTEPTDTSSFPPVGYSEPPPPWPGHLRVCSNCVHKVEVKRRQGHPNACDTVRFQSDPPRCKRPDLRKEGNYEYCPLHEKV